MRSFHKLVLETYVLKIWHTTSHLSPLTVLGGGGQYSERFLENESEIPNLSNAEALTNSVELSTEYCSRDP
jgi:hypothetical protein